MTTNNLSAVFASIRNLSDDDFAKLQAFFAEPEQPTTPDAHVDAPQGEDRQLCECFTADGTPCALPAKDTRKIGRKVRNVCHVHSRASHAYVTAAGAKKHAAAKQAEWDAIVADREAKKAAREARKAAQPAPAPAPESQARTLVPLAELEAAVKDAKSGDVIFIDASAKDTRAWAREAWDCEFDSQWHTSPQDLGGRRVVMVAQRGSQGKVTSATHRAVYVA